MLPDGRIQTIEGNTDLAGNRTGGGVWRKRRATASVVGCGHPGFQVEDEMTPEEELRLANVESMLVNLMGQFGWTETAPGRRDFAWRGVPAWDVDDPAARRNLTLLDLLRENHRHPGRTRPRHRPRRAELVRKVGA